MTIQSHASMKVRVSLTGDDKFVHGDGVIDEVWITVIAGKPRSNAVWLKGVTFYTGATFRGRARFDRIPGSIRAALLDAARRLPEGLP